MLRPDKAMTKEKWKLEESLKIIKLLGKKVQLLTRVMKLYADEKNWKEIEEMGYSHGAQWTAWNGKDSNGWSEAQRVLEEIK